jgi:signal transduction histidine kinase
MMIENERVASLAEAYCIKDASHLARMAEMGAQSSSMAHDLNNLLQIIVGNLDFVAAGALDEKAARHLALARVGVERCTHLARRTLRQGCSREAASLLQVPRFLEKMADRLSFAGGHGITIEIVAADAALVIDADEAELENALLNLVLNARDAMDGRGRIRISCHALQARGSRSSEGTAALGKVVLLVEDTGPGIAPEIQGAVLERFFTTKAHGTGLGLANVRAFMAEAGGTLAIGNRPEGGAVATLSFPQARTGSPPPHVRSRIHVD